MDELTLVRFAQHDDSLEFDEHAALAKREALDRQRLASFSNEALLHRPLALVVRSAAWLSRCRDLGIDTCDAALRGRAASGAAHLGKLLPVSGGDCLEADLLSVHLRYTAGATLGAGSLDVGVELHSELDAAAAPDRYVFLLAGQSKPLSFEVQGLSAWRHRLEGVMLETSHDFIVALIAGRLMVRAQPHFEASRH